ncbi:LAMI_0B07734g1_1 [Lachancea mirantina]|uniref:LAMI_0B07734g1_1 n=1 Tax=Lachancea mirantina TaxID=1230905 RepID=A0A1G4IXN3_9SACH|nr:LAMI_0B07734g1_1 [Lachancea mirantina]
MVFEVSPFTLLSNDGKLSIPMDEPTIKQRQKVEVQPEGVIMEERTTLIKDNKVKRVTKRRLYTWDEIPEWQRDNEHIIRGYVMETKSLRDCIIALTYWHNESINIYTHLIPACFFLLTMLFNEYLLTHFRTTGLIDIIMIDLFLLGGFTCLMMSSTFHCLKCHSIEVATFGNKLDYLGIVALIVSSMVSILYYGFFDNLPYFLTFSSLTISFGIACATVSLSDRFRTREWRPYRAMLFVAFGLSALIPIIAGAFRYGVKETWVRIQVKWVIFEGVFYILGAFLYGVRFPERVAPGKFDIWGHSHQLFHVLVVVAACCHFRALLGAYALVHKRIVL